MTLKTLEAKNSENFIIIQTNPDFCRVSKLEFQNPRFYYTEKFATSKQQKVAT